MGITDISIDEVFRMAVELEREGARFYRRAAEQSAAPPQARGGPGAAAAP